MVSKGGTVPGNQSFLGLFFSWSSPHDLSRVCTLLSARRTGPTLSVAYEAAWQELSKQGGTLSADEPPTMPGVAYNSERT
jgi:hypothetical protein